MGSFKQAGEAICTYGGEPKPRTGQIMRDLQGHDMLPRGVGKRISPTQLATTLLAVAVTPRPVNATRSALTWGRMTPGGVAIDWDEPVDRRPMALIEALTACIGMVWKEGGHGPMTNIVMRSCFELSTNTPHAIVTLNGERNEYLPVGGGEELPGFHRVARISGEAIRQIAMAIYEGPHHYDAAQALQPGAGRDPYHEPASILSAPLYALAARYEAEADKSDAAAGGGAGEHVH